MLLMSQLKNMRILVLDIVDNDPSLLESTLKYYKGTGSIPSNHRGIDIATQ